MTGQKKISLTNGSAGPQNERQSSEQSTCKVPPSTPRNENENDGAKNEDEPSTNFVLSPEEALRTLINGRVNLRKTARCGLIVRTRDKSRRVRDTLGFNGYTSDEKELDRGP